MEVEYPEGFQTGSSLFIEKEYRSKHSIVQGSYKEVFFDGIHIGYGDFMMPRTTFVHFDSEFESIGMHFALQGRTRTNSKTFKKAFGFKANQHNLIYAKDFKGAIEWCSHDDMKIFEINLLPSFINKYLPEGDLFDIFRKCIEKKEAAVLSPHNYPITPQMMALIHQILSCSRTGHFKRMFLESSVLELLMLQLEQIDNHNCKVFCAINKQHEEKLYAAKEILNQQLSGDLTLNSLAQQIGTNEFTLKKGFKELFGTTVFGYWNQVKMSEAMMLLSEGAMNVSEISRKLGYKNPQHFSAAFKRHFGYSPSKLKVA